MPTVSMPRLLASSKARSRLSELPLVDRPTAMSVLPPKAATCRAKTTSTPMSLLSAVSTDASLARLSGGQRRRRPAGRQEQRRQLLRVGCAAAVAEGQQPAARREPRGHVPRAGQQPGAVGGPHRPAQLQDLLRLGDRRLTHLLEHGGHICRAGVEERVKRLDRAGSGRPRAPCRSEPASSRHHRDRFLGVDQDRVADRGGDQGDADFLDALAGVDERQAVVEQPDNGDPRQRCPSR